MGALVDEVGLFAVCLSVFFASLRRGQLIARVWCLFGSFCFVQLMHRFLLGFWHSLCVCSLLVQFEQIFMSGVGQFRVGCWFTA